MRNLRAGIIIIVNIKYNKFDYIYQQENQAIVESEHLSTNTYLASVIIIFALLKGIVREY